MAAISATILGLLAPGDEVLFCGPLYGKARSLEMIPRHPVYKAKAGGRNRAVYVHADETVPLKIVAEFDFRLASSATASPGRSPPARLRISGLAAIRPVRPLAKPSKIDEWNSRNLEERVPPHLADILSTRALFANRHALQSTREFTDTRWNPVLSCCGIA
jgi:hypothetical protein